MKQAPEILIHTALYHEAVPIIAALNLKQYETRPFRIFRGGAVLLVVSGVGRENTRNALNGVLSENSFKRAINIGMAGCADTDIPVGALFRCNGRPDGLPEGLLVTVDTPQVGRRASADTSSTVNTADSADAAPGPAGGCKGDENPSRPPTLVDMEGEAFLNCLASGMPWGHVHVLKVVSDHLDDTIPGAPAIQSLISGTLSRWSYLVDGYSNKLDAAIGETAFYNLPPEDQAAVVAAAVRWRFSHQEIRQITEMAIDLAMWEQSPVSALLGQGSPSGKAALDVVRGVWSRLKEEPKSYRGFKGTTDRKSVEHRPSTPLVRSSPGFGRCPVASPRTRCCNLLTLDAVEGCGFDCSYCSIRYFYRQDAIGFDENLISNLKNLEIDPELHYHIGTGQSSDSLMWGNKAGILDALIEFAGNHPNVILELKTKSDNIGHLLKSGVPPNILITWSLNTQPVIDAEEHYTASLNRRLEAAAQMADAGSLVGFHLHPMVYYKEWREDYGELFSRLVRDFRAEDVAMVSLGTLTFIKPVIKNLRRRGVKSRILQMPLELAEGKLSYPRETKKDMFSFAYNALDSWHKRVFFYLCMEDSTLWPEVFGFEYADNNQFENAMKDHYREKIREKRDSDR